MTRYHSALLRLAAASAGLSLFAACSANSTVPAGVQGETNNPLVPAAKRCKEKLYVSSYKLDYVAIYCTKGHNQAPIGKITDGKMCIRDRTSVTNDEPCRWCFIALHPR